MTTAGTTTRTCRQHRRRESLASCTTCSAPLCGACIVHTPVGFKCQTCTGGTNVGGGRPDRRLQVAAGTLAVVVLGLLGLRAVTGGGSSTASQGRSPAVSATPTERNVQFDGADGLTLGATLGLPAGAVAGDGLAGVVILPGFGPTDRNGSYQPGRPADLLYQDLGTAFVDGGMVTFRYDKRGTGQSVLPADTPLAFDDMVADAAAAVEFLAERGEVDPRRIAVVGHEEGGLVALQLAASDERVASIVLVSVPGRPLVQVVADDFRNSGQGHDVDDLESVVAGLLAGADLAEPEDLPASVRSFFPTEQAQYAREIFSVDPVALARRIKVPTLVVRGDQATGISAADAEALAQALGGEVDVATVAGVGHTLREAPPADDPDDDADLDDAHIDGGGGPRPGARDQGALDRILQFLTSTLT